MPAAAQDKRGSPTAQPQFVPKFRLRQWLLVSALSAVGLWLVVSRSPSPSPEFESVSMASAQADYYLESLVLISTNAHGDLDYTLSADTLIHLPGEAKAIVSSPSLLVHSKDSDWALSAQQGTLPDHGKVIDLTGDVQLEQLAGGQTPVRLSTPSLRLDRQRRLFSSDSGVAVEGPGWQLRADKMTGRVDSGKLIFRDNNHVQYAPPRQTEK